MARTSSLLVTADADADSRSQEEAAARRRRLIRLLLALQFLLSVFDSWAFGGLFDVQLFLLSGGSNGCVGLAESLRGIMSLVAATPLGYAADVWPRHAFLLVASLCGVGMVAIASIGLLLRDIPTMIVATVLSAIYLQGLTGASTALLADLAAPGPERASLMGWQQVMMQIGKSAGPLVQLLLLVAVGATDAWSPTLLATTLTFGLLLPLLVVPVAWAIWAAASAAAAAAAVASVASAAGDGEVSSGGVCSSGGASVAGCGGGQGAACAGPGEDVLPGWAARRSFGGRCKVSWIVVVAVEVSFVLTLLLAGMAVKYFPLYFKQDFHFGPLGICALNAAFPLVVALCVPVCVRLAQCLGQVQGILLWTCLGAGSQIFLARARRAELAVACYMLRNAFMKSRDPLYQALLMDCLEKRHRGRFGAVLAIRSGAWAGSGWFGGLFLDRHHSDYRLLFELSGWLILSLPTTAVAPMLCLVPRRRAVG